MAAGEVDALAGQLLAGRYRVIDQVGAGGMGVVHQAVDEVMGRQVAVKVLRANSDATGEELTELRTRMGREARAAARIRHHGVITTYDVAEHDGRPIVVMELIDGPSLEDVLEKGPLEPQEAARIGEAVMDALDAAHRVGVLHRDVKPGNILLETGGRVVLADFGIAGIHAPGDGAPTNLTRTGQLVGSLDYMPPERADDGDHTPAGDVWSLGMTLFTAVEGAPAFHRSSVLRTLNAIVDDPLPDVRRAGHLAPLLTALLHKDPGQRPTAAQAREMLAAAAAGVPHHPEPDRGPGPADVPYAPPSPVGSALLPDLPSFVLAEEDPPPPGPARSKPPYTPASLAEPAPYLPAVGSFRRGRALALATAAVVLAGGATAYALATTGTAAPATPRHYHRSTPEPQLPVVAPAASSSPARPSIQPSHHPTATPHRPTGAVVRRRVPAPPAPSVGSAGGQTGGVGGAVAGTGDGGTQGSIVGSISGSDQGSGTEGAIQGPEDSGGASQGSDQGSIVGSIQGAD